MSKPFPLEKGHRIKVSLSKTAYCEASNLDSVSLDLSASTATPHSFNLIFQGIPQNITAFT